MTGEDLQEEDHVLLNVALLLHANAVNLPREMHPSQKRNANQALHRPSDLLVEMLWKSTENVHHLEEEIVLQNLLVENHLGQVLHLPVEEIVLRELLELLLQMVIDPTHKIESGLEVRHQQTKAERRDKELLINCQ